MYVARTSFPLAGMRKWKRSVRRQRRLPVEMTFPIFLRKPRFQRRELHANRRFSLTCVLPLGASNQSLMKGGDVDVKHPTPDISSDCVIAEWTDRLQPYGWPMWSWVMCIHMIWRVCILEGWYVYVHVRNHDLSPLCTLPETNIAPENWWLEYDRFLLIPGLFSGDFAVSCREGITCSSLSLLAFQISVPLPRTIANSSNSREGSSSCDTRRCQTKTRMKHSQRWPVTPRVSTGKGDLIKSSLVILRDPCETTSKVDELCRPLKLAVVKALKINGWKMKCSFLRDFAWAFPIFEAMSWMIRTGLGKMILVRKCFKSVRNTLLGTEISHPYRHLWRWFWCSRWNMAVPWRVSINHRMYFLSKNPWTSCNVSHIYVFFSRSRHHIFFNSQVLFCQKKKKDEKGVFFTSASTVSTSTQTCILIRGLKPFLTAFGMPLTFHLSKLCT